jgi:hypothetical protein
MIRILTGDGLGAGGAPLGEELAEALGAVRLVVAGREPLARQRLDTVRAEVEFNKNTLPMKVEKVFIKLTIFMHKLSAPSCLKNGAHFKSG